MTPHRLLARLRSGERGAALVEFAIILPVMLTLYLGGYQLFDAIACKRKVTIATRAIGDLVSRSSGDSTSDVPIAMADVDTMLNASTQIMSPYQLAAATVRISEVTTDYSYNTKVVWSRASDPTQSLAKNTSVTVPTQFKVPGVSLLMADTAYAYRSPIGNGFVKPMTLKDQIFLLPRNSDTITCTDCP